MPGRDGERSGTGVPLARHLRAAFTERIAYKAAALFFAIVLSTMKLGMLPPGVLEVAMRHSVSPFSSSMTRSTLT